MKVLSESLNILRGKVISPKKIEKIHVLEYEIFCVFPSLFPSLKIRQIKNYFETGLKTFILLKKNTSRTIGA